MNLIRYAAIAALAYVGLVVLAETLLGFVQPRFDRPPVGEWEGTIVITTVGSDGSTEKRVVTPMLSDGRLIVSANHWPRSWYRRVLENQDVQITSGGKTTDFRAVIIPPDSPEHDELEREHPHSALFRFATGYPPRRFVRLEPR
jgi:hypothetical protein